MIEAVCIGVLSVIITGPNNTLVVRGRDNFAYMTCASNDTDDITWRYDGNTVINSYCIANTDVFMAEEESANECNIRALLANATNDPIIMTISGLYHCTDRTSNGVLATSMVIVLGKLFCIVKLSPAYLNSIQNNNNLNNVVKTFYRSW